MSQKAIHFIVFFLIAVLVAGSGYAGWKHFFGTLTEEELREYTPLVFESIGGTPPCIVEAGSFYDGFFEPRYFVLTNKAELDRLAKKLRYDRILLEDLEINNINFEQSILLGALQPLTYREVGDVSFSQVSYKDKTIIGQVNIIKEIGYRYELGEPDKPLRQCVYDLIVIARKDFIPGINMVHFINAEGRKLKEEKLLIEKVNM